MTLYAGRQRMVNFRGRKSWQGHWGGFWGAGRVESLNWGGPHDGYGHCVNACPGHTNDLLTFQHVLCTSGKFL